MVQNTIHPTFRLKRIQREKDMSFLLSIWITKIQTSSDKYICSQMR